MNQAPGKIRSTTGITHSLWPSSFLQQWPNTCQVRERGKEKPGSHEMHLRMLAKSVLASPEVLVHGIYCTLHCNKRLNIH